MYHITLSVGLAASYRFNFRGHTSRTIAHNAPVDLMQTTLAEMAPFRDVKGRAATFVRSATAAAGTTFSISISCDGDVGSNLITIVTQEAKD